MMQPLERQPGDNKHFLNIAEMSILVAAGHQKNEPWSGNSLEDIGSRTAENIFQLLDTGRCSDLGGRFGKRNRWDARRNFLKKEKRHKYREPRKWRR